MILILQDMNTNKKLKLKQIKQDSTSNLEKRFLWMIKPSKLTAIKQKQPFKNDNVPKV